MSDLEIILKISNILAISIIGYFAYSISKKQNEINKRAADLADYADVFLMPQGLYSQEEGSKELVGHNLLIKNASSLPIYLNKYILNGKETEVGSSMIPVSSENWYKVRLPEELEEAEEFSMDIYFEDFMGRKYKTKGFGEFNGVWSIRSKKRSEIKQ